MKFLVTMHMPSNQGKPVHQITCEIEGINSLPEFLNALVRYDFLLINEYYYDAEDRFNPSGKYKLRGRIIINCSLIGKVRELEER